MRKMSILSLIFLIASQNVCQIYACMQVNVNVPVCEKKSIVTGYLRNAYIRKKQSCFDVGIHGEVRRLPRLEDWRSIERRKSTD